jgi:GT2 family glycosyltransferase
MSAAPRLSVVVCTRERPHDLERCLRALAGQTMRDLEVIVVDNAPRTNDTRRIADDWGARYAYEPRPGLDYARNAGVAAALAPAIAFTDDDAVPAADWAAVVVATLSEPGIAGMGGAMLPLELETSAQQLFERYLERMTRSRPRDERRVFARPFPPSSAGHVGAGANMAFRRSALDAVGPFDEAFDAGTATQSGGDTEMFARMLDAGLRLVYEPRAVVRHRHRRTVGELRRQLFGYGVGVYAFWTHRVTRHRDRDAFRFALQTLRFHAGRLPDAVRGGRGELPTALVLAELAGSVWGPVAYATARRRARRMHERTPTPVMPPGARGGGRGEDHAR